MVLKAVEMHQMHWNIFQAEYKRYTSFYSWNLGLISWVLKLVYWSPKCSYYGPVGQKGPKIGLLSFLKVDVFNFFWFLHEGTAG